MPNVATILGKRAGCCESVMANNQVSVQVCARECARARVCVCKADHVEMTFTN